MIKPDKLKIARQQSGFTLVEAALSIALLAIVAVGVLAGVSTSLLSSARTDTESTAMSLALRQMESIELQSYQEADIGGEVTYDKLELDSIPSNYSIWSYNREAHIEGEEYIVSDVIGVPWYSDEVTAGIDDGQAVEEDGGLQKIKLVIKHGDDIALTVETYKVR